MKLRKPAPEPTAKQRAFLDPLPGQRHRKRPGSVDVSRLPVPDRVLTFAKDTEFQGPNREERRRSDRSEQAALRQNLRASKKAFFCTALDRRVHMLREGSRTTSCGRHAMLLVKTANVHKNRCPTCAKEMA